MYHFSFTSRIELNSDVLDETKILDTTALNLKISCCDYNLTYLHGCLGKKKKHSVLLRLALGKL